MGDQMVLMNDGFGGTRYYPENSEMSVLCSYFDQGHRYVIIQYLDLPFSYRLINLDGLAFVDKEAHDFLKEELFSIDEGVYDNAELAGQIKQLMT
ncbi:hypothetical protein [Halobacillus sp. Cin3]|nr:hypothetical protein [Halobacillus sp. Cin3]